MVDTRTNPESAPATNRRRWVVPLGFVAAVVIVAVGGAVWFLSGDTPAEVDLEATAAAVTDGAAEPAAASPSDIGGTWSVDTSVGDFTLDELTTATFVGFRVDEVLASIGSTTAVGRSPEVAGTITIDGTTLVDAEITADLTAIVSDESRREDSIQDALNTSTTPMASFVLTEPVELGNGAAAGDLVEVTATGDLTINGITNEVAIDLSAQSIDGMVLVTGTTDVVFADYDVQTPTSRIVVSAEDEGIVEIQLWFSR